MTAIKFRVVDRKGEALGDIELPESATVGELVKDLIAKTKMGKKVNDVNRVRLTVGEAKGRALSDRRQALSAFFTEAEAAAEITLVFKDLGLQISWKLVFLIEYFGPILITGILVAFQKQIYGKTSEYTFN